MVNSRTPASLEREGTFARIHRNREWGSNESASGPGSTRARAAEFLPELVELVRSLDIATLLDTPCGK